MKKGSTLDIAIAARNTTYATKSIPDTTRNIPEGVYIIIEPDMFRCGQVLYIWDLE